MEWIETLLARNAHTQYLRQFGSPRTAEEFCARVPVVTYDDLKPWLAWECSGQLDVLFAGRAVAFERTSGSSGAAKLIPYSAEGLGDVRRAVEPWIAGVIRRFELRGSAYLALSPATRAAESIGDIPVGVSDDAYAALPLRPAVPAEVAAITDVEAWRRETVRHLRDAHDLELISVWSPTFLLRLLDECDFDWPRLKVISCWASGASKPFADALASRFPGVHFQPKGLISTECVVTIPDHDGRPRLNPHGFFEFRRAHDDLFEVIATTASGLYRYRTGDLVRFGDGIEFAGRGALVSDLAGEKLSEPFVASCLEFVPGVRFLTPRSDLRGYVLMLEEGTCVDVDEVERRLSANPQYAYARRIGQLEPLDVRTVPRLFERFVDSQLARGARLGDIKVPILRTEWSADASSAQQS